jgi:hypothetical protein
VNVAFAADASDDVGQRLGVESYAVAANPRSADHFVGVLLSDLVGAGKAPVFEIVDQIFIGVD